MASITSVTTPTINGLQKSNFLKLPKLFEKTQFSKFQLPKDTFEKASGDAVFSKATFDKAKSIVMETILGKNPKESCVYIMDDKIIHYELGDSHCVKPTDKMNDLMSNPNNRLAIVHSHPIISKDGSSYPVSYGDFLVINRSEGARSIYAINSLGEYSTLQKEGNVRPSLYKEFDYEDILKQMMIDNLSGEDKEIMERAFSGKLTKEETEFLAKEFEKIRNKESGAIPMRNATHNFWLKYAPELGVKYDTNFSCFK